MPGLRKQISHFLQQKYGMKYDWDEETLITVGVSEGLDLALRAILNPGDKVLVPEPSYVSYCPVVELAGANSYVGTFGGSAKAKVLGNFRIKISNPPAISVGTINGIMITKNLLVPEQPKFSLASSRELSTFFKAPETYRNISG